MPDSIRPTPRGIAVVMIVLVAFATGSISGPRSLDAIVVPGLVVLGASFLQLRFADPPTISREPPEPGFPGDKRTIEVTVDSTIPCVVDERTPTGIGPEPRLREVGHGGRFTYEVRFERRGIYELGPATCKQTDSIGLFSRYIHLESVEPRPAVVYPPVYELDFEVAGGGGAEVFGLQHRSFSHLREYTTADRLGDIHWRSSAKRPSDEFLVTEHERDGRDDRVSIVGESVADGVDSMAAAIASLADAFGAVGVAVDVTLSDGESRTYSGAEESLLWLLASTDGGRVPNTNPADIRVVSDGEMTTIRTPDQTVDFDERVETSHVEEAI